MDYFPDERPSTLARAGETAHPDIFPDQRAGPGIVFRDPPTLAVEHRMDGDRRGRGQRADRLATHGVVLVGRLQHAVDAELRHPAGGIVGIGVGPARPRLGRHIARSVISVSPRATRREGDGGQLVRRGGIGIGVGRDPKLGRQPVAHPVIGIGQRAIGAGGRGQVLAWGVGERLGKMFAISCSI